MAKDAGTGTGRRKSCFISPHPFTGFGKTIRYVVCFDENGSSSELSHVSKALASGKFVDENRRYFTLTGCLFDREGYFASVYLLKALKLQFWDHEGSKILLHSRDIRRKLSPFNFSAEKYQKFINALSNALAFVPCTVFSMTFDLLSYVEEGYQHDPYSVAFDYLLERIVTCLRKERNDPDPRIALVFEARGTVEDRKLLEHASQLIYSSGTKWASRTMLQKWVHGVFSMKNRARKMA